MPKYVIERNLPGVAKLSAKELSGVALDPVSAEG